MAIEIQKATNKDIDWVNKKYDEVAFQHSNLDNEIIAIAEIDGKKAGIGRLVKIDEQTAELGGMYVFESFRGQGVASKIVQFLLDSGNQFCRIFCLPFEELEKFYGKYGFKISKDKGKVPEKILKKHEWCNETYDKKVLLLSLERTL
jgi:N-acetylglutamate synthase-like GNAT family acetyltransferase